MSDAAWSMVVVSCAPTSSEIVSDALWSLGVVAIEERPVNDASTGRSIELWTSVGGDPAIVEESLAGIDGVRGIRREGISRSVADTWRRYAEPVRVSDELRIVPAWLAGDSSACDIFIDPFDTFGLGNHPTSVGALRLLLSLSVDAPSVLDIGTGSGILAIAMAKNRHARCVATDISISSAQVVAANCRMNDVQVEFVDELSDVPGQFDIVVANILAPVLRDLSDDIVSKTRLNGTIVLAGMRDNQVESVLSRFPEFYIEDSVVIEGWHAMLLRRRSVN